MHVQCDEVEDKTMPESSPEKQFILISYSLDVSRVSGRAFFEDLLAEIARDIALLSKTVVSRDPVSSCFCNAFGGQKSSFFCSLRFFLFLVVCWVIRRGDHDV